MLKSGKMLNLVVKFVTFCLIYNLLNFKIYLFNYN